MPSPREALHSFTALIVTGGSSGIGKSFIESAGNLHPTLRICNLSRTVPVIKTGQLNLCHVPCDLANPVDIERATSEIEVWLTRDVPAGRVLLINNSGFGSYGRFPEPNLHHQLELLDVNIRGLVHFTGAILPQLKSRGGVVVNVASTAAFQPTPYMSVYGASKAFVLNWSLALAQEWAGTALRCVALCPGPTATSFFRRAGLQQGTVSASLSMTPEQVVDATWRAVARARTVIVPGWKNRLITTAVALVPRTVAAWVAARVIGRYRLRKVAA